MARAIPIAEAAAEIGVSPRTVRGLLERGEIRGHRVGRAVRVYLESLEDYQRRNEITPRAPAPDGPKRPGRRKSPRSGEAMQKLARLGIMP